MSSRFHVWFWCLLGVCRALELDQLFEFGSGAGDQELQTGSDSSVDLQLSESVFVFSETFSSVQINTNGFVAVSKLPPEEEYLGKMPVKFKMIAALLGDLDNSDGQGKVYFREDKSPAVLTRTANHIKQAFPNEKGVEPISTIVVTWENMSAHGTSGRGDGLDVKRNTFQLVVASMKRTSCAILLYPKPGLQFSSTSIGGSSKLLEAGFNEGEVTSWLWGTSMGTYFRITTEEENSVRQLSRKSNSGQSGVWVYEIGSTSFYGIIPGMLSKLSEEDENTSTVTTSTSHPNNPQEAELSTYKTQMMTTTKVPENNQLPSETPMGQQPTYLESQTATPGPAQSETITPDPIKTESTRTSYVNTEPTTIEFVKTQTVTPTKPRHPDSTRSSHPHPTKTRDYEHTQTTDPTPQPTETRSPQTFKPTYPEPDPVKPPQDTNPDALLPLPPYSRSHHPQIVVVDEDLNVDVFGYNLETCDQNRNTCSVFAACRDYGSGFCCYCNPGHYGNGKTCLKEGEPQRVTGKVTGRVFVGQSDTPVALDNSDFHSYVVTNEGRAYVAISNINRSLGPSLQLLSSVGGVIGWTFALEQPGYQNAFRLTGGVFSRLAEVIFQPGNERLIIRQDFKGLNEHGRLQLDSQLEGRLPVIAPGSSVHVGPYTEIYQYSSNLITSSSTRTCTVTTPEGDVLTRNYQWRQTITFHSCLHDDIIRMAPPTQLLSVDHVFVTFEEENELIRYATRNKIGSVNGGPPEKNPCFTGEHGCDHNAVCRPAEGRQFTCQCLTGFTGDGRICYDVDECSRTPPVCGSNGVCTNQPGTFRCECSPGFLLAGDGKVCIDVDECRQGRCHRDAVCTNTHGSYSCRCQLGFHGDGFQCSPVSSDRELSQCERDRENAQAAASGSFQHPHPAVGHHIPQCDEHGAYEPMQCHAHIRQCWCVDANGREIPNTLTGPGSTALCINHAVTAPPVGPTPRPDVSPVTPGTHLLFVQSGKIEHIPLDGYKMRNEAAKPLLHVPDRVVIAVAYDCVDKTIYWTDITGPAISKATVNGGDVIPLVTTELQSPEGVAIDHVARLLFWTDSMRDTVEVAKLDGSQRRILFHTDLVNPRPIVTDPKYGLLYWADWNRDGPKIEMSNMDGTDRTILVQDDLGLPNGLTYDPDTQQLCWADAGTRRVECMDPHRRLRRRVMEGIQYPFDLVSFGQKLYYTDWRRDAVIAVDRHAHKETAEFLPQKRSRLYGITTLTTKCLPAYNYCHNNGGCSHLCLPRAGGFTCRCPDAGAGQCEEDNL
ncbi:nidogen-1-like [Thalassophryne amazonica]|uniref:nidogen-1-like n=1 Tax=Thalassophryne amazonica TaxID=390379 RepID=UPI0014712579|nr:nidogen-1-like [Thalassophryne amazonica]